MLKQTKAKERIYSINEAPERTSAGLKLSDRQVLEAKEKISKIFG